MVVKLYIWNRRIRIIFIKLNSVVNIWPEHATLYFYFCSNCSVTQVSALSGVNTLTIERTWLRIFQKRVVRTKFVIYVLLRVRVMVFNATFNNISVISWRSVLLVEETGVPRENHRPVGSHWQTLLYNVVSSKPRHERDSNSHL